MNWRVKLTNRAEKDLKHWEKSNTKIFRKCLGRMINRGGKRSKGVWEVNSAFEV